MIDQDYSRDCLTNHIQDLTERSAGKRRDEDAVDFSSTSDWLRRWCKFFGPITAQIKTKPIAFYSIVVLPCVFTFEGYLVSSTELLT